jgi:hypothetical protein
MRKLASVQKIISVSEIKDPKTGEAANSIEAVKILGWECVAKKGEFKSGDLAVYFEIDSIIPDNILKEANLWKKEENKGMLGKSSGNVLTTRKMLGVLSQGLVLPLSLFRNLNFVTSKWSEDTDLTEHLNILKYERFVEEENDSSINKKQPFKNKLIKKFKKEIIWLSKYIPWFRQFIGQSGPFPDFIQKTDQERIQNLIKDWEWLKEDKYEITEKMEGTSSTYFYKDGDYGMCSRNLRKPNTDTTHFGKVEEKYGIFKKLIKYKKNIALQGEICGPRIQGNYYNLSDYTWFIFDVYLIDEKRKALPGERQSILTDLGLDLHQCPFYGSQNINEMTVEQILEMAICKSFVNTKADSEGLVFKSTTKNQSFKVINNNYLLKQK